jgi:hypothetical protein
VADSGGEVGALPSIGGEVGPLEVRRADLSTDGGGGVEGGAIPANTFCTTEVALGRRDIWLSGGGRRTTRALLSALLGGGLVVVGGDRGEVGGGEATGRATSLEALLSRRSSLGCATGDAVRTFFSSDGTGEEV